MSTITPSDFLVITSAGGKQASNLLPFLPESLKLRLVVHSASSATRLRQTYPKAEVLTGDLNFPTFCTEVVRDATALYHIGPPFNSSEKAMGLNLIAAATFERRARHRFRHFVYSSVLHSIIQKMLNHDCKRYVEEALVESGLPFTILQPTHFMDMIPVKKLAEEEGDKVVYPAKWDPSVEFSFVALKDLGEVASKVLDEGEKHYGATYEMCGTGAVSYNTICQIIGEKIGKEVVVEQASYEESVNGFLGMTFGEDTDAYNTDCAERMLLYYNRRGIVGNPNVMGWILGKKPLGIAEWIDMQIGKRRT